MRVVSTTASIPSSRTGLDLAEGHAGLHHAERAGIHAERQSAGASTEAAQFYSCGAGVFSGL